MAVLNPIVISFADMGHCGACGVPIATTEERAAYYRNSGKEFVCINGHGQRFVRTEADALRAEIEAMKRAVGQAIERSAYLQQQLDESRRSNTSLRGVITRLKRRARR